MKKKILITGASGMIGNSLIKSSVNCSFVKCISVQSILLVNSLNKSILKPNNINYPNSRLEFTNLFKLN